MALQRVRGANLFEDFKTVPEFFIKASREHSSIKLVASTA
jgi:hypothetical protein